MSKKTSFEIPPELRDLTEKNIEQAQAVYGHYMDFLNQTMKAWSGTASSGKAAGFKAVQQRTVELAKENADSSFALAHQLASAKDIQEVLHIQSKYAQTQMQRYSAQAQELGELMSEAMSKAMRDS